MTILGIDLGGTKLAVAVFDENGSLIERETIALNGRGGTDVGALVADVVRKYSADARSIGICVPGISRHASGTVWAPNIPGWDDYPLLEETRLAAGGVPVSIDSDRACCILGEHWKGNARGCQDAIFIAVGTGIGAGILAGGRVLRGAYDIAGAIGWLALDRPFDQKYEACGCFESRAAGDGIARVARELLAFEKAYVGVLRSNDPEALTSHDVFDALAGGDGIAQPVVDQCVELWGMAAANLVSIFNPEKIIFGGGVFGPATALIPKIREEAAKWAQPIAMRAVTFEPSALGADAGLYGAGLLALRNVG